MIAYVANVGQQDDFAAVKEKALSTGTDDVVVEDLRETFLSDFVWPTIRAGAVYERKYLLGSSHESVRAQSGALHKWLHG